MTNPIDKLPPHNIEAERAVLGALLIDGGALPLVATIIQAQDFYKTSHGWVYEAMEGVEETADYLVVCDALERQGRLKEIGGPSFVTKLLIHTPTSLHVEHYAHIVKRCAIQRQFILAAGKIAALAYDDSTDTGNLVASAEETLAAATHGIPMLVTTVDDIMASMWENVFDPQELVADRVFTGFPGLDGGLLGIESGRFWVTAAVPGTGKSAFAVNLVRGIAQTQKNVAILYFHPEQSGTEITGLLWSGGTPLPGGKPNQYVPPLRIKIIQMSQEQRERYSQVANFLQTSTTTRSSDSAQADAKSKANYLKKPVQAWEKTVLGESQAALGQAPIMLHDPSGETINEIRSTIRRVRAKLPPNVFLFVVFDGMHLIPGNGEGNRQAELMTITRTFKIIAQKDVQPGAVWVSHQLNRGIYASSSRTYHLGLLRDSGTVEQDADGIMFLDRPSVWASDKTVETWDPFDGVVAKNRQTSVAMRIFFEMHTSTMQVRGRDVT